jgi:glycogen debranching enzyme
MSGIARGDRAERVARQLMEPDFFSGWGVRTVAVREARYNPMSYHNGSVWPHDNAMIATGFARYGDSQATGRIFQGMFDAATYMDLRRLPELFCGFPRFRGRGPTLYPVACTPQAWSSGVFLRCCRPRLVSSKTPSRTSFDFAIRSCRRFSAASFFADSRRAQGLSIFQCTVNATPRSPLKF